MHDVVVLYDQVVEATCRVRSFCLAADKDPPARSREIDDDVRHVSLMMARRDLLLLAATTRNFAEAAQVGALMRGLQIRSCSLILPHEHPFTREDGPTFSLTEFYNRIIHSIRIELLKEGSSFFHLSAQSAEELGLLLAQQIHKPKLILPFVVAVTTDRKPLTIFKLETAVSVTLDFLHAAGEYLEESQQIVLQREYRDV